MFSRFVLVEFLLPSCLIVTLVTEIFFTFMNRFLVYLKMALLCSLVLTLVTRILSLSLPGLADGSPAAEPGGDNSTQEITVEKQRAVHFSSMAVP